MTDAAWVAAFVVAVLATARITSLFVYDSFPPTLKLRTWWFNRTNGNQWSPLLGCGQCFSVWSAGWVVGTALLSFWLVGDLHWAWWALHGLLATAYLSTWVGRYGG